jgi:hypothetical protein
MGVDPPQVSPISVLSPVVRPGIHLGSPRVACVGASRAWDFQPQACCGSQNSVQTIAPSCVRGAASQFVPIISIYQGGGKQAAPKRRPTDASSVGDRYWNDADDEKAVTDMTRPHQPDQAVFRAILPEDIDWQPFPAFPPAVRLVLVVGHPAKPRTLCDQG